MVWVFGLEGYVWRYMVTSDGKYLLWKDMFGWSHQMVSIWFGRICLEGLGHIRWWVFGCGEVRWQMCPIVWTGTDGRINSGVKSSVEGVKIAEEIRKHIQTNLYFETKKYLVPNRVDGNWWPRIKSSVKSSVEGVKIAEGIGKHIQTNLYSETKEYLVAISTKQRGRWQRKDCRRNQATYSK